MCDTKELIRWCINNDFLCTFSTFPNIFRSNVIHENWIYSRVTQHSPLNQCFTLAERISSISILCTAHITRNHIDIWWCSRGWNQIQRQLMSIFYLTKTNKKTLKFAVRLSDAMNIIKKKDIIFVKCHSSSFLVMALLFRNRKYFRFQKNSFEIFVFIVCHLKCVSLCSCLSLSSHWMCVSE